MVNEISDRLKQYFDNQGITQRSIADVLQVDPAYINKLICGKKAFGKKTANQFQDLFGLSASWLLTGEGQMLVGENVAQTKEADSRRGMIPFYDAETTGGYNGRVSSSDGVSEMVGYIEAGGWFAGRETAAIRHVGDSMTEYPEGCILAVREVLDRSLLVPGKNYVVETSEYRVTKRVQHGSSPDTISLYSTNQEKYEDGRLIHEPFEVRLTDVRRIFSVLGYIVNQSGEFKLIKA